MSITFPSEEQVRVNIAQHPADMIHFCAEALLKDAGIKGMELRWVLASYELRKARIHQVVMSDGVNTTESFT